MQPQPLQKQKPKANHDKHAVKQSVANTLRDPAEKHMQALSCLANAAQHVCMWLCKARVIKPSWQI